MKYIFKDTAEKIATRVCDDSKKVTGGVKDACRKIDGNHEKIADYTDTAAKTTRVAAGVAVVGASVAAPTGLTAIGVAAGIISAPAIVTAAPILIGVAGAAFTISSGAALYSKLRKNNKNDKQPKK